MYDEHTISLAWGTADGRRGSFQAGWVCGWMVVPLLTGHLCPGDGK